MTRSVIAVLLATLLLAVTVGSAFAQGPVVNTQVHNYLYQSAQGYATAGWAIGQGYNYYSSQFTAATSGYRGGFGDGMGTFGYIEDVTGTGQ